MENNKGIRPTRGKCPKGLVWNPNTKRCVKPGGKSYRTAFGNATPPGSSPESAASSEKSSASSSAKSSAASSAKSGASSGSSHSSVEKMIMNEETGRSIRVGGPTYRKLVSKGHTFQKKNAWKTGRRRVDGVFIYPKEEPVVDTKGKGKEKVVDTKGKGKEKVVDTKGKGKEKVVDTKGKYMGQSSKQPIVPPHVQKGCKNAQTFTMFENVEDIAQDHFVKLSNGYCYDKEELSAFLESEGFTNKNPHDMNQVLFDTIQDRATLRKFGLAKKFDAYQKSLQSNYVKMADVFYRNMDLLYTFGNVARILMFDQNFLPGGHSTESSHFHRSVETLVGLTDMLEKLPAPLKSQIYEMKIDRYFFCMKDMIDDANHGRDCIHGIGNKLLHFFVFYFLHVEQKYPRITYDITKTRILFTKVGPGVLGNIIVRDIANLQSNSYINSTTTDMIYQINPKTSLLSPTNKKKMQEFFDNTCVTSADLATLEGDDKWSDIAPWRVIKLPNSNFCFDIYFLIKYLTVQFNASDYNNPKPAYPKNPFNQLPFTMLEIESIAYRIKVHGLMPMKSNAFTIFIYNPVLWDMKGSEEAWRVRFITTCEQVLRYERLPVLDSQENFTGQWVAKDTPYNAAETHIYRWLQDLHEPSKATAIRKTVPPTPETYYFVRYRKDEE